MIVPQGEAGRVGMISGNWSSAIKQFFGTAYEAYDANNQYSGSSPTAPISRVWFTGAEGVLTEVYWPRIDTPQVKDCQFLVSDGHGFFAEERHSSTTTVQWLQTGVPAYHITNAETSGRYVIERTIFADPDRDVVVQHIKITRSVPGLQFYVLHKPVVGNAPMDNNGLATIDPQAPTGSPDSALYAWKPGQAQAVVFSVPLREASAGFVGANDGWQDLSRNFQMTNHFRTATDGNVALTAHLDLPDASGTSEFDIALGFGGTTDAAYAVAAASIQAGWNAGLTKYMAQWSAYQQSLTDLSGASTDGGTLFRTSMTVLKGSEDKTYEGAIVASPTIPWGEHLTDSNYTGSPGLPTGGYHQVWPRDLYQMASAFMAAGDFHSALACLNWLRRVQLSPSNGEWQFGSRHRSKDGSFFQNYYVDGSPYWSGLQLDEAAMPAILAYRLWQAGVVKPQDYWDLVHRAADMIADFGPWTEMERWEETFGASPSTIATEITALWTSAEFAAQMGDQTRATRYRTVAQQWSSKPGDNVDTWTFTTTGSQFGGRYYTRITGAASYDETWNPDAGTQYTIKNGGGEWKESDIVDAGFLELVRFGVRGALDQTMTDSISAVDHSIRVDIPGIGPSFHRYNGDRYNYDGVTGAQTDGMLWPLLTGERGHYELAREIAAKGTATQIDAVASAYVTTMEGLSTAQHYLPEQVWESGPGAGQTTGSATPLGWSHAEYVKLLRSRADQAVFDRIPVVVLGSMLPAQR